MSLVALSELLGATVRDASGTVRGRVREIAVAPQDHPTRIAFLVVKTADGERMLPLDALAPPVTEYVADVRLAFPASAAAPTSWLNHGGGRPALVAICEEL